MLPNEAACEAMIHRNYAWMRKLSARMARRAPRRSSQDAEDFFGDLLVDVTDAFRRGCYDPERGSEHSWIRERARLTLTRRFRGWRRTRLLERTETVEFGGEQVARPEWSSEDERIQRIEANDGGEILDQILGALDERTFRAALAVLEESSNEEVVERLGKGKGRMWYLLRQARRPVLASLAQRAMRHESELTEAQWGACASLTLDLADSDVEAFGMTVEERDRAVLRTRYL